MTAPQRINFGTFALQAVGLTVLLTVAAWWLAHSRYGAAGPPAVVTGLAISLVAALVSGWFLARRSARRQGDGGTAPGSASRETVAQPTALFDSLGAMGVRLLVLTALVVVAVVSEAFLITPLLLSVAVGYVVLLGLETRFALALTAREARRTTARAGEVEDELEMDEAAASGNEVRRRT